MNKVGLITDLHIGVYEHSEYFRNYQLESLKYHFNKFKEKEIKRVFILGDIFNNRKHLTFYTLYNQVNAFKDIIKDFEIILICGNHDTYYKSTNEINSLELIFKDLNNIHIVSSIPKEFDNILCVPWLNQSNLNKSIDKIKESNAKFLFGHFEFSGFELIRGIYCEHNQFDLNTIHKFDKVFSGHFHCSSEKHNIVYIGSPYQLNWSDYNESKRSIILDLDTGEFENIFNPYTFYEKIHFNSNVDNIDIEKYRGKSIKVYLNIPKTINIEKAIVSLNEICNNCNVIDNTSIPSIENEDEKIDIKNMSIIDVFKEYLNGLTEFDENDKINIMEIFIDSYKEVVLEDK